MPPPSAASSGVPTDLARRRAALLHLSALLLFPPISALAAWMVSRSMRPSRAPTDEHSQRAQLEDRFFLEDHARETINFHLSMCVWWLAALFVAAITCLTTSGIAPVVLAYAPVCALLAARAASRGRLHRYPMTIRMLRQ